MCAKRTMALKGLKGRLRELAKNADCYEEVKLNLMLEGWNLDDDEKVKAAVKKWMLEFYRFSTYYTRKCFIEEILGLEDGARYNEKQLVARCNVVRGMWEDAVGVEDKKAAMVGALLVANAMTSTGGWNAATVNVDEEDKGLEAVGRLAAWLGTVAWGGWTKTGS